MESRIILFILITLTVSFISGLEGGDLYSQERRGEINVIQDARLEELLKRHAAINKESDGIPGFRIRIFSQSGQNARNNANDTSARFYDRYPEIKTHLDYDPPNFKVYVGDFRTRSEALKTLQKISSNYPHAFIVSATIDFPPLD